MSAARIVMQAWARSYQSILLRSGLRLIDHSGYVDDGRQLSTTFRRGMRYDRDAKMFLYSEQAEKEDAEKDEPSNVRMARICKDDMNDINGDLSFTTEAPEDFPENRLPTLDFKLWLIRGIALHSYYEKEMRTPYVIMKRSALGEHQRVSILANELIRRLSNVHLSIINQEIKGIIEHYVGQLKMSGYDRSQTKEIITCGVVGWRRKVERREREGRGFYRLAKSTLAQRNSKKLTEKVTWFRGKRKREDEEEDEMPRMKKRDATKKDPGTKNEVEVKAVMFVPFTTGG